LRAKELVVVGEMPVEHSIKLLLLPGQAYSERTDPRQTKVEPEEKIPPLGCGAQHDR
jgi:hypothetical protein